MEDLLLTSENCCGYSYCGSHKGFCGIPQWLADCQNQPGYPIFLSGLQRFGMRLFVLRESCEYIQKFAEVVKMVLRVVQKWLRIIIKNRQLSTSRTLFWRLLAIMLSLTKMAPFSCFPSFPLFCAHKCQIKNNPLKLCFTRNKNTFFSFAKTKMANLKKMNPILRSKESNLPSLDEKITRMTNFALLKVLSLSKFFISAWQIWGPVTTKAGGRPSPLPWVRYWYRITEG